MLNHGEKKAKLLVLRAVLWNQEELDASPSVNICSYVILGNLFSSLNPFPLLSNEDYYRT